MTDALASASASFEVLQRQLNDCTNNVEQLQNIGISNRITDSAALSASVSALMVRKIEMLYLVNFILFYFKCLAVVLFHHKLSTLFTADESFQYTHKPTRKKKVFFHFYIIFSAHFKEFVANVSYLFN